MKLLALSDMHSSEEALDRLKVRASRTSYDAVILCGDLTNRGPLSYAEEILGVFPKTYAVHGNMDSPEVAKAIARSGAQLHGKKVKFGEWNLVGLGGSNPTPFNTPNELSEEEIE
ncbi:MAG: metallophosphoesterase family protein, partial [Candidatus Micrarchaeota archaeon]|nr:metallophosphoesterase family protein [Candidatus Micrarchaeota archaeon]